MVALTNKTMRETNGEFVETLHSSLHIPLPQRVGHDIDLQGNQSTPIYGIRNREAFKKGEEPFFMLIALLLHTN